MSKEAHLEEVNQYGSVHLKDLLAKWFGAWLTVFSGSVVQRLLTAERLLE